jgi:hypothetical protein
MHLLAVAGMLGFLERVVLEDFNLVETPSTPFVVFKP